MDKDYLITQLADTARRYGLDIDTDILGAIVSMSVFRVAEKGELIRRIGDDTLTAGLVLNGLVRSCYIDGDGNDITRGFADTGMLCMDEGLFGYAESICEWEALEETTLMVFGTEKMKSLIHTSGCLGEAYIMLLERALRYKIYRENGFLTENATERYIHFRKLYPDICLRAAQHHIATYLGIAPESLSRIRKALKENE